MYIYICTHVGPASVHQEPQSAHPATAVRVVLFYWFQDTGLSVVTLRAGILIRYAEVFTTL